MLTIKIPKHITNRLVNGPRVGRHLVCVLDLGWPELRLTEEQILANAVAIAYGDEPPFPNKNLVALELPYPDAKR